MLQETPTCVRWFLCTCFRITKPSEGIVTKTEGICCETEPTQGPCDLRSDSLPYPWKVWMSLNH